MNTLIILPGLLLFIIGSPSFSTSPANNNSIKDIEGNEYKTVIIGNQVWMAENLRTTTYNDGTPILHVKDKVDWLKLAVRFEYLRPIHFQYQELLRIKNPDSIAIGGYCWNNNDSLNAELYGALYNWYAVKTKKLCPVGWHVPTDDDWKMLEGNVDSRYSVGSSIWTNTGYRGHNAAKRLKSNSGWAEGNGTDDFEFNAYPGGAYSRLANFFGLGWSGFFWTANKGDYPWTRMSFSGISPPGTTAWARALKYNDARIERRYFDKRMGGSVRCIKTLTVPDADFSANPTFFSNTGDTIYFRDRSHRHPTSWKWDFGDGTFSTSQNPTHVYNSPGIYRVSLVATNKFGSDTAMKEEYIQVHDYGKVTDIDGNTYDITIIGEQQWMAENLRSTRYNDGIPISNITDSTEWASYTGGTYSWYMNDSAENASDYGALYNKHAVVTGKLCPLGWSIPTNNDWKQLNNYLIANGYEYCRGSSLKAAVGWSEGGNGTDDLGFKGLPAGLRRKDGSFDGLGVVAIWWAAPEDKSRKLNYWLLLTPHWRFPPRFTGAWNGESMPLSKPGLERSVRCVKD